MTTYKHKKAPAVPYVVKPIAKAEPGGHPIVTGYGVFRKFVDRKTRKFAVGNQSIAQFRYRKDADLFRDVKTAVSQGRSVSIVVGHGSHIPVA